MLTNSFYLPLTFAGLQSVGDPHVDSRPPGRRIDDYLSSVLGKLDTCADTANDRNLLTLITGDLMNRYGDNSISMLNRLIRTLKRFKVPPLLLDGNHDREELTKISDSDLVQVLVQTGLVCLVREGEFGTVVINGKPVRIFGAPSGAAIPSKLPAGEGRAILCTHHDLAFGGAYPGALPLVEIPGCDMVLNGHMHAFKESVVKGCTTWHNHGNIEPLTKDLVDHKPRSWVWSNDSATDTAIIPVDLPHGVDLFNMTGSNVQAAKPEEAVKALLESAFASTMQEEGEAAISGPATSDASLLEEDLATALSANGAQDATKALFAGLMVGVRREALEAPNSLA